MCTKFNFTKNVYSPKLPPSAVKHEGIKKKKKKKMMLALLNVIIHENIKKMKKRVMLALLKLIIT